MKTILVINDQTSTAFHAAKFALNIAQKVSAKLMVINTIKFKKDIYLKEFVLTSGRMNRDFVKEEAVDFADQLMKLNEAAQYPATEIGIIDSGMLSENELVTFIMKNNIWMVVKGVSDEAPATCDMINMQTILNKIRCPILFVPEKFDQNIFERIVYTVDLRYCRLDMAKYLKELAAAYGANLIITHIAAKGLPDMEQSYAREIFNQEISSRLNYDKLFFLNLRQRDVDKAFDVLLHGVNADLVVFVNRRFHFEEIIGSHLTHSFPEHITVPILVFPR